MAETTHRMDENGIYRQLVTPQRLREILDEDGDDYSRPTCWKPEDEWDVASDLAKFLPL